MADKVYDGNTMPRSPAETSPAIVGRRCVSLVGGSAAFDTKNVGTAKTVTLTGATLAGDDEGNYTLGSVATSNGRHHAEGDHRERR